MIVAREPVAEVLVAVGASEQTLNEARIALASFRPAQAWFIGLFTGFAAWLSAALFCMFLVQLGVITSPGVSFVLGGGVVAGACVGRWIPVTADSVFLRQLALAMVLAGEGLITYGLVELVGVDGSWLWLIAGSWMAFMVIAFPDSIHQFAATVAASVLLSMFLYSLAPWLPVHLGATVCFAAGGSLIQWQAELDATPVALVRGPVAVGLVAATFLLVMLAMWGPDHQQAYAFVTVVGLSAVIAIGLVWSVLDELGLRDSRVVVACVAGVAALGALTASTPGMLVALATLVLAFHRRHTLLFGMGAAFLAAFLAWFYYDLALSLWGKSSILLGSGALLLGARALIVRSEVI